MEQVNTYTEPQTKLPDTSAHRRHFGLKADKPVPTENSRMLDLKDGFFASYKKAANHMNKDGQGVWTVDIITPQGGFTFNADHLEQRISDLRDRDRDDYADKFQMALDELKVKTQKTTQKMSFAGSANKR